MNKITTRIDKNRRIPRSKRDTRKQRRNPVHVGRARPCEDQLADRDSHGGYANDTYHAFWWRFACCGIDFVAVDHASDQRFCADGYHAADADSDVGKAGESIAPAAEFGEDDGVGDEAEVHDAVYEGDVDVPENAVAG